MEFNTELYDRIRGLPSPEECLYKLVDHRIGPKCLSEYIVDEAKYRKLNDDTCPYSGIPREKHPTSFMIATNCGLRIRADYFLVANNHIILEEIYEDTPWAGSLWNISLSQLKGAEKLTGRLFYLPSGKQERQRCVKIPLHHVIFEYDD